MSLSASINIQIVSSQNKVISSIEIIKNLMANGWTLNDNGKTSYLPIGDDDDYNWILENIDSEKLLDIFSEKEKRNEIIGVSLTWKDTNIGGMLLIFAEGELSLNLTINKKYISNNFDLKIIDVNWYLEKLIPGLNRKSLKLISFSFEQVL